MSGRVAAFLNPAMDVARQLVAAIPAAWRGDWLFRWSAVGAMVTFIFLMLGWSGPRPQLPPLVHQTATPSAAALPSPAVPTPAPASPPLPSSPALPATSAPSSLVIAPGRPLGAAPAGSDDRDAGRFGTLSPRRPN